MYSNVIRLASGRVRLVCEFCGRESGPRGGGGLEYVPLGWTCCPFPTDYIHADGTTGTLYSCPDCDAKITAGEQLTSRNYTAAGTRGASRA